MDTVAAQAQVQKALDGLGNSAAAVAGTLRASGIQGVRNTARFLNPVVRFIQQSLPSSFLDMDLTRPNTLRLKLQDGSSIDVDLPAPVRDFLHAFDQGAYPDLEAP
jgi:hypothetical protein